LLDDEVRDEETEISTCDGLIDYFNNTIKEIKENFKLTKQTKINDKKSEIKANDDRISNLEDKIKNNQEKLSRKQKELSSIKTINVDKVEKQS
jgi:chromosome segregation ATPase